ncbi:hypothetical protein RQP46_005284 [Phenoliferia psychrophenolica]
MEEDPVKDPSDQDQDEDEEVDPVKTEEDEPLESDSLLLVEPSLPLSPNSATPLPAPSDFSSILSSLISQDLSHPSPLPSLIIASNLALSSSTPSHPPPPPLAPIRDLSNVDLKIHREALLPFLLDAFEQRDRRRWYKTRALRTEYKVLDEDWKAHCRRLDRIKDRVHRRSTNGGGNGNGSQYQEQRQTTLVTPSIDPAGLPFYPGDHQSSLGGPGPNTGGLGNNNGGLGGGGGGGGLGGPSLGIGRTNRRNQNTAFGGYGDAVRSEAEFLEILASLETADMRDPNVRATRTAAVVPDMVVDPSERADLLQVALEDERRRVDDPVEFYGVHHPLDLWTESEVHVFCKRFSQHPKQFGRIAADLPDKSTKQCVLFYYRMKNTIDFRSLSDRRGRDGRRRSGKTRRRTNANSGNVAGGDDGSGKKTSLLSNLKRARTDDREDMDEDSPPPPSPRNGRISSKGPQIDPPTPSVFQAPESTSRPGPIDTTTTLEDDLLSLTSASSSKPKKSRSSAPSTTATTPKLPSLSLPLEHNPVSEGVVEAAEALGALAALAAAAADIGGAEDRKRTKARGGLLDPEDAAASTNDGGKTPNRRKSASSSYWTVAERNEFVRLLALFGKDWTKLAEGLENKTAVQCKNWFQNHAKKLNLAEIAKTADGDGEDGDDETGSGALTPSNSDFTVPTGIPLSESLTSSHPRAGFFVPDGAPRTGTPLSLFDDSTAPVVLPKAGMQIRNLLNDDSPTHEGGEPAAPMLQGDWFGNHGSSAPGTNGNESATTEDESELPKPRVTKSPPPRQQQHQQQQHHQQQPHQRQSWDLPPARSEDRRFAYEAPPSAYRPQPQPQQAQARYAYPSPMDRYDTGGRQPQPVSWQPSASYPPPYGPSTPLSSDFYSSRSSLDIHDRTSSSSSAPPSSSGYPPHPPQGRPVQSPYGSRDSYRERRATHPYQYALVELGRYRDEPIEYSDSEPESDKETKKGFNWRQGAKCSGKKPAAVAPPAPPRKDFKTVYEEHKDELLARDRQTGKELETQRREYEMKKKVKEAYAEWKEQQKRSRRLEDRWHQHRFAEEDRLRQEALRQKYEAEQGDEPITEYPDFTHLDRAHRNLARDYRGFELGAIGKNNTVPHRTVIPSLEEILYPAVPDPHKRTIEDPPEGDIRDHPLLSTGRAQPIPWIHFDPEIQEEADVAEYAMQLDEVDRMLESARTYAHLNRGSENALRVKRLERESRRLAEALGVAQLYMRRAYEERRLEYERAQAEQEAAAAAGEGNADGQAPAGGE